MHKSGGEGQLDGGGSCWMVVSRGRLEAGCDRWLEMVDVMAGVAGRVGWAGWTYSV